MLVLATCLHNGGEIIMGRYIHDTLTVQWEIRFVHVLRRATTGGYAMWADQSSKFALFSGNL